MKLFSPAPAAKRVRIRIYNRKKIAFASSVFALVVAGLVFLAAQIVSPRGRAAPPAGPEEAAGEAEAPGLSSPPSWETKVTIRPGSTLATLLGNRDFSNREIHRLKEAVKPVYDLARIKAGRELRIRRNLEGGWESLEYRIDDTRFLLVNNTEGGIRAEIRVFPFEFRPVVVRGVIDDNPSAALHAVGETDALAIELEERCFGWDIDFYTDIRRGDGFKVLVEKKYLDGRFVGYGNILAAEFTNDGETFEAFRFVDPETGAADFYDAEGDSKRKEFLKSPLKGGRITSRFSTRRLHPIYKVYRPHFGVDIGAPIGTPVQATADGEVTFAGRDGGAGNMVRLKHKNGYETMYLHLSRYGPGVRKGAKVGGGDIVGYVGSSGDSNGPHLDYRIRRYGNYLNPLSVKFKAADPLPRKFLETFKKDVMKCRAVLETTAIEAVSRTIGWAFIF
jgi:murein DD-endopeptidase MepM/ murein hydrolase activator NlpD